MKIPKGSTDVTTYLKLIDPAAGTPETGLTITDLDLTYVRDRAAASKADATALAAVDSAHGDNKAFEVDGTNTPGLYRVDWPDAAFAAGVDRVQLCVNGAAIDPAYIEVELGAEIGTDGKTLISTDAQDLSGTLDVNTKTITSGAITATAIATDAIDADSIKADAAVEVAAAVWDRAITAATHNIATSAGRRLRTLETATIISGGTAAAGGASTITLAAAASATNDFYMHDDVTIVAGTGAGQARKIDSYDGGTKVATVSMSWVVQPDATSEYEIVIGIDAHVGRVHTDAISADAIAADAITEIQAGLSTHSAADVWSAGTRALTDKADFTLANGAITAAVIATDAIDADSIKADAVTEIQSGLSTHAAADVWAVATRALTDKAGFTISGTKQTLDALNDIAAGAEMDLVDAPNATAITAIQAGLSTLAAGAQMDLIDAPNATAVMAIQSGLSTLAAGAEMDLVNAPNATAITAIQSGLATSGALTTHDGKLDTADAAIDAVQSDLDNATDGLGALKTLIDALNDLSAADVNAEVVDALQTDALAELAADPGATPTFAEIGMLLYQWLRSANTCTESERTIKNDAGDTILTATVSDDATTGNQGKLG